MSKKLEKTCSFLKEENKCSIEHTREVIDSRFYSKCDFDLEKQPCTDCKKYFYGMTNPPLLTRGMPVTLRFYDTGETIILNSSKK